MGSILTDRQAEELHKSIIAYLAANNLSNPESVLREELDLGEDVLDAETVKKYEFLLQKKWTSTVRLQRKACWEGRPDFLLLTQYLTGVLPTTQITDLETRNAALQSEINNAMATSTSRRKEDPLSWLPECPPQYSLKSHQDTINSIAFHPVYSSIASGSDDCTIKIWDWELGELEQTVKGHTRPVLDVDYGGTQGGTLLASCSSDLNIKLWDPAQEYKNIRTLPGHDHCVSAIRFIPSQASGVGSTGNLLVGASRDQTLRIWDVLTGHCVKVLQGHTSWVRDVCPSSDTRFLLSTGDDMTVRLWDISLPNPEIKLTMVGHEHFNECCTLAPPASYPHLAHLAGRKPPPASSTAEFMASGSRDKTVRVWDASGTCLATLEGHNNWVRAVVFHPGGKYLLSASDDKTLRCWDLTQGCKCVKVLDNSHERFVTCLKWAPTVARHGAAESNTPRRVNGSTGDTSDSQIRCVLATGSVDKKLRIFAA